MINAELNRILLLGYTCIMRFTMDPVCRSLPSFKVSLEFLYCISISIIYYMPFLVQYIPIYVRVNVIHKAF